MATLRIVFAVCTGLIGGALVSSMSASPPPALACSGGIGGFDEFSFYAESVAVVEAVRVGAFLNTAPTATPAPTRSPTSMPSTVGNSTPTPTPQVDLRGVGATLRVTRLLAGDLPPEVEVDLEPRDEIERGLRTLEANPNFIFPCELDFLVERYEAGKQYVVFLTRSDATSNWLTYARLPIDAGAYVVLDSVRVTELVVSGGVRRAYFASLPAQRLPDLTEDDPLYPNREIWLISVDRVPLVPFLDAVLGVHSGAAHRRLHGPSTGDGGIVR